VIAARPDMIAAKKANPPMMNRVMHALLKFVEGEMSSEPIVDRVIITISGVK